MTTACWLQVCWFFVGQESATTGAGTVPNAPVTTACWLQVCWFFVGHESATTGVTAVSLVSCRELMASEVADSGVDTNAATVTTPMTMDAAKPLILISVSSYSI